MIDRLTTPFYFATMAVIGAWLYEYGGWTPVLWLVGTLAAIAVLQEIEHRWRRHHG